LGDAASEEVLEATAPACLSRHIAGAAHAILATSASKKIFVRDPHAITELEDRPYTATQTVNFTPILNRITATLSRLVSASFETKKTLINSVIQRLDVGNGEIVHFTPSPCLGQTFFLILGRDNHALGELLAHLLRPKDEKLKVVLRLK